LVPLPGWCVDVATGWWWRCCCCVGLGLFLLFFQEKRRDWWLWEEFYVVIRKWEWRGAKLPTVNENGLYFSVARLGWVASPFYFNEWLCATRTHRCSKKHGIDTKTAMSLTFWYFWLFVFYACAIAFTWFRRCLVWSLFPFFLLSGRPLHRFWWNVCLSKWMIPSVVR